MRMQLLGWGFRRHGDVEVRSIGDRDGVGSVDVEVVGE